MISKDILKGLEELIISSYESGTTLDEAEKLASRFLHAMMQVSQGLRELDLDSRMKKTGVKAVRAAVYMAEATKGDKKPSDVLLAAHVDRDSIVQDAQTAFDEAESNRDELERYFNVFKEAHVHYRQMSKGRFDG